MYEDGREVSSALLLAGFEGRGGVPGPSLQEPPFRPTAKLQVLDDHPAAQDHLAHAPANDCAFVGREVGVHVQRAGRQAPLGVRIKDDQVRIGARPQCALARGEPVDAGRLGRGELDQALERYHTRHDAQRVQERQASFDAGQSVGDAREGCAGQVLLRAAERAMIGCDHVDVAGGERGQKRLTIARGAQRRSEQILRAVRACEARIVEREVLGTGLDRDRAEITGPTRA